MRRALLQVFDRHTAVAVAPLRHSRPAADRVVDIHDHARQRKDDMQRFFPRMAAALAAAVAFVVLTTLPASAHENRPVGPLQFTVGWGDEPTYTGYKNSVTLRITRGGQPVANVTGIKAEVKTGDQTIDLTLDQAFGEPGLYEAPLIPTRTGTYTFTFTGTVNGQDFEEEFTSGEDTFDAPREASEVAFPAKDPSAGQLAQRIARDGQRLEAAQAAAADAKDKASTATTIAIAGIVAGVLGLVIGVIGLNRRR